MKLEALKDNIVIQLVEQKEDSKTMGLIFSATEARKSYKIIDLGIDVGKVEPDLSVGDIVYINKRVGTEIDCDGTDYLLVNLSDVLAFEKE